MSRPLYIFDLDGTLALTEHRQHILDDKSNPHRWVDFFAACVFDEPNKPVIETMASLSLTCDIMFFSGRSEDVRSQTLDWLTHHTCFINRHWVNGALTMRRSGSTEPDDIVKERWLNALPSEDRERLVAVFDDRQKVVDMWRRNDVACFQVRPSFD
jgi:hypothetical protein